MEQLKYPNISEIAIALTDLSRWLVKTPAWQWRSLRKDQLFGSDTEIFLKLELFQHTGTFKPRGALTVMLNTPKQELAKGVTAVSAGNHAIAVAYAAQKFGVSAKVVVPKNINKFRLQLCKDYGAEVVLTEDIQQAFDTVKQIEKSEQRIFIHPFDGPFTTLGTATLGFEFCKQVRNLDAILVAIGGGGLASGVACAVKQLNPECKVYGVEPEGANTMYQSFASGNPESIKRVTTIADSLGAPRALPYSFSLCKRFIDNVVLVDDASLIGAMRLLFEDLKLAVEPAGAAVVAALQGPLRDELCGKRIGLIICGSIIDVDTFGAYM